MRKHRLPEQPLFCYYTLYRPPRMQVGLFKDHVAL